MHKYTLLQRTLLNDFSYLIHVRVTDISVSIELWIRIGMELKVIGYNLSPNAGVQAIASMAWMQRSDREHIIRYGGIPLHHSKQL